MRTAVARVGAFVIVGWLGFVVQLASVLLFARVIGVPILIATAGSVVVAVLHNFAWHVLWTWRDRAGPRAFRRLVHFTLATGSSSIASNVAAVAVLAGICHMDPLVATTTAVAATSVLNYWLCDRYVFA